ncbi:methyl-accepting chemotaxis protein [Desulforegula conservatrix]|uniref:methyl-accepting chemotaxis protein n=1 Tax=Desulforegula conservatrix TaxID=153026 RepID=UPI00041BF854|nr:methyl-accepting chemotaxis protein [Desulforegula conservatrix]
MNVNFRSISFRLMAIGFVSVLVPLATVGIISVSKSSDALMKLSKETVQMVAQDLSSLVNKTLNDEVKLAGTFSSAQNIIKHMGIITQNGGENSPESVRILFDNLKKKFEKMGDSYQGIFVADTKGNIVTGILEGGKEYKGINISDSNDFARAMKGEDTFVGDVITSKVTGSPILTVVSTIKSDQGQVIGVYGAVIKAEYFSHLISDRKIGDTGYGYMINGSGTVIAHPKQEYVLKLQASTLKGMESINSQMLAGKSGVESYVFNGVHKIGGFAPVGINGWSINVAQDSEEFLRAASSIRNVSLIVGFFTMLIVGIVIFLSSRAIVNPINSAVEGLKDIASGEGDLTKRLDVRTKDEVGELARWFNIFMEKLQGIIRDISGGVQTLASSSTELSVISEGMSVSTGIVSEKAVAVAAASEEMSASMGNVAVAMEQSAANTNMLATASEEMSSTISEIAINAEKARNISGQASQKATSASVNIDQLGLAANAIGKVIETISDISDQVNLLALNATIEAARAGEAGRGFAVVANEIKELARQTADASQDIKGKVEGIQRTTSVTVTQISEIAGVIVEVNEVVSTIAAAVEEQSAATKEIASNVAQVSAGIQEVNANVNQSSGVVSEISGDIAGVSASMSDMSAGSNQVNTSAQELSRLSEQLRTMVDQFKV